MSEKVTVACPNCRKSAAVPPQMLGRTVQCRACGKEFRLEAEGEALFKPVDEPREAPAPAPAAAAGAPARDASAGEYALWDDPEREAAPQGHSARADESAGDPLAGLASASASAPRPATGRAAAVRPATVRGRAIGGGAAASAPGTVGVRVLPGRPGRGKGGMSGGLIVAIGGGVCTAVVAIFLLINAGKGGHADKGDRRKGGAEQQAASAEGKTGDRSGDRSGEGKSASSGTTPESETANPTTVHVAVPQTPAEAPPPPTIVPPEAVVASPPPTEPPPAAPTHNTGERYQEWLKKLDDAGATGTRDAQGKLLKEFRAWGETLRKDSRPDVRQWADEVTADFTKRMGDYYVARLELDLPEPNQKWPGLDSVPRSEGFYKLFDGKKLHTTPYYRSMVAYKDGEVMVFPRMQMLAQEVGAFANFELDFEVVVADSGEPVDFGFTYGMKFVKDSAYQRLDFGPQAVELFSGTRRQQREPVAKARLDRPIAGTVDMRFICRNGKHTLFVNGKRVLSGDAAVQPGRFCLYASWPLRLKSLQLAVFDAAPPAKFEDEYPVDEGIVSTGSGWVCAPGGYIMTNNHVIDGVDEGAKVWVQIAKDKPRLPAEVVARDKERDMAVIRVKDPKALPAAAKPMAVDSERAVKRGEDVAAFGYPGNVAGEGLTLTQGVVSKVPAPDNNNLLVLSTVVNPGNSGGPLVDTNGNVIGMITYKLGPDGSYGGAVPAPDLAKFLKANIPGFAPVRLLKNNFTRNVWGEVDAIVSPSVFMIVMIEKPQK